MPFPKAHVFTEREEPLTRGELVAAARGCTVEEQRHPMDEASEYIVRWKDGMWAEVRLVPEECLKMALSADAFDAARDSVFDDPRFPDDIARSKQLIALTCFAYRPERSEGHARLCTVARGIAARLQGFYGTESAFFTPHGEVLATPKPDEVTRPVPPDAVRVARRALILCAVAERSQTDRKEERVVRVRAYDEIRKWIDASGVAPELSPAEHMLFQLLPVTWTRFGLGSVGLLSGEWGYEAVGVLAWALGIVALPKGTERTKLEVGEMLGYRSEARPAILERARLRSHAEIVGLLEQMKDADARRNARGYKHVWTEEDHVFEQNAEERRRAVRWLLGVAPRYADASGRNLVGPKLVL